MYCACFSKGNMCDKVFYGDILELFMSELSQYE